jgi:GNAT superfamily N-acetyltransferase
MSVLIRDAVEADLGDIHRLAYELAVYEQLEHLFVAEPEHYREAIFGPDPTAFVLIAEIEGQVAGIALCFRTFSTFLGRSGIWLEDLFVDPNFRRRGVASALLAELKARTPGRLEWEVLDWNEDAMALYDGVGAQRFEGWTKYRVSPEG